MLIGNQFKTPKSRSVLLAAFVYSEKLNNHKKISIIMTRMSKLTDESSSINQSGVEEKSVGVTLGRTGPGSPV